MFDVGPARCKRGGTMPCPGAFTARLGSELARKPLISSEKVIRLVVWLMVVAAIERASDTTVPYHAYSLDMRLRRAFGRAGLAHSLGVCFLGRRLERFLVDDPNVGPATGHMDVMGMRAGGYLRVLGVGEGGGVHGHVEVLGHHELQPERVGLSPFFTCSFSCSTSSWMTLSFAPTSDLHFEVLELLELRSEHAAHLVGLGSHLVEREHELRVDSAVR